MTVLVVTLGFDERFAMRSIMRHGDRLSRVLVVHSEPVEERARLAENRVREFVERYLSGVSLEVVVVDASDLAGSVAVLRKRLAEFVGEEVVLNLSGGMRSLGLEVLLAAVYSGVDAVVEVELENLRGFVSFDLGMLAGRIPSSDELRVLSALSSYGETLDELSNKLSMPRSTVFKRLRSLVGRGLVREVREGRRVRYAPTSLARIWLE